MSCRNSSQGSGNPTLQSLQVKLETLEQEKKRLEEQLSIVNRERVEYLQNVSHQLVAPLNAIKWHIENLTQGRMGVQRAEKVLRSIYSQSTIAVHLAKNFALMSNLEADHALTALKEPLQPVVLCALLINLADDFQPLGWVKGIQIRVDQEPLQSAPSVLVMKPLISQVFSNIIENAVKYSHRESVIRIDGRHDPKTDTVSVNVRNRGIPLPPGEESNVFARGYRSTEARNQYPAGTGFGLYIARRIVEMHEGKISVETDNLGQAVFTVRLSVRGLEGKARTHGRKDGSPYRR